MTKIILRKHAMLTFHRCLIKVNMSYLNRRFFARSQIKLLSLKAMNAGNNDLLGTTDLRFRYSIVLLI